MGVVDLLCLRSIFVLCRREKWPVAVSPYDLTMPTLGDYWFVSFQSISPPSKLS
jgi:hypothetical protein